MKGKERSHRDAKLYSPDNFLFNRPAINFEVNFDGDAEHSHGKIGSNTIERQNIGSQITNFDSVNMTSEIVPYKTEKQTIKIPEHISVFCTPLVNRLK